MLNSFNSLKNHNKCRLLVAGKTEKNYLKYLKEINNSNRVIYLGYTDNNEFFKKIDVLIVPSLWNEPFGRVVLEAIINNKIVITSTKGGIKEIIENNYFYVDKTLFIKEILDRGDKILLIPRPRRFGKTLNLSMLKYFYDCTPPRLSPASEPPTQTNRSLVCGSQSFRSRRMGHRRSLDR